MFVESLVIVSNTLYVLSQWCWLRSCRHTQHVSLLLPEWTTGPARMEPQQHCQPDKIVCLSHQEFVPHWELIIAIADRRGTKQWQWLDNFVKLFKWDPMVSGHWNGISSTVATSYVHCSKWIILEAGCQQQVTKLFCQIGYLVCFLGGCSLATINMIQKIHFLPTLICPFE